jgi:hypothetical protein
MGVRTVAARPKSIWFDTGDEDQNPAQAPAQEPDPPAPAAAAAAPPQPVEQETAPATAVDEAGGRLPIYDSIESEWFRRGGTSFGGGAAAGSWTSPADEGFRRAAETVVAPVAGQATTAGLPKRVPSANLVPGSIAARPAGGQRGGPAPAPALGGGPSRTPEAVRARLTGFQMRGREGRTGAPQWSGTERQGTDDN